jgi:hypothetical protein
MIELTEQQRVAVKNGEAVRVTVPEIGEEVVLVRASLFQHMKDSLEERIKQEGVLDNSTDQPAQVATEDFALTDPIEAFIGAFASDIPDWTTQPDQYLGQTLMKEMSRNRGS